MHFARNALAHAGRSGRRVVAAFIATAFAQNDVSCPGCQVGRLDLSEADGRGYRLHADGHENAALVAS